MSRSILTIVAVFAVFGVASLASAQGVRDAALRQEIAIQKLMGRVDDAIKASYKQAPTTAKAALLDLLDDVANSMDLLPTQRAQLRQRLQARLNGVNDTIRSKSSQEPRPGTRDFDRPKIDRPPTGPSIGASGVAKTWIEPMSRDQKIHADLIRQREAGIQGLNMGIEKSGVLTDREITFPSYWRELTKAREKTVGPQLTDKEVKLLKTLNSVMSVEYDNDKFKAVLNHIQEKTGLAIIVDEGSMRDAMVDYDDPVTFKIGKVSVRTILKKILGDKSLTYIIKEGTIQVMTPKKASEYTVVRTYQVDDLIAPSPQMQMMFGPFVAQAQMQQNAQMLINLIQSTVSPDYWQPNGPGSIVFFPPTKSLIIRASAEMHYQMSSPGLFGGR
ncbi:MAG: hypothetical protein FJ303_00340 [Planctomycetes bacterium]|nr:hypothetical protein [Planctomycetota bacterium]